MAAQWKSFLAAILPPDKVGTLRGSENWNIVNSINSYCTCARSKVNVSSFLGIPRHRLEPVTKIIKMATNICNVITFFPFHKFYFFDASVVLFFISANVLAEKS